MLVGDDDDDDDDDGEVGTYRVDRPSALPKNLDREIEKRARTASNKPSFSVKYRYKSLCRYTYNEEGGEDEIYLTTRFEIFTLGDDTFMIIDVILPTMLGSEGFAF